MSGSRRIGRGLTALSSAAVVTVYTAGYLRTRAASDAIASGAASRRRAAPIAVPTAAPTALTRPAELALPMLPAPPAPASRDARPAARATASSPASTPSPSSVVPVAPFAAQPTAKAAPAVVPPPIPAAAPIAPVAAPLAAGIAGGEAPRSAGASQPAQAIAEPTEPIAAAAAATSAASALAAPAQLKDGTYTGWGSCRHGDIQASVVVAGGRIESAAIAQCLTRYSCSWIEALPAQVVRRQSPEVDYVSGATQSTDAFYGAIVEALSKAK